MKNKELFTVDTAWPFPIIQYTTNVSYVEVRRASGIAYILLQLINNSENNSEKLINVLKKLGVPDDIHDIFKLELANMIGFNIIEMRIPDDTFNFELFKTYIISAFKVTDLGKKLFSEGAIPTGNIKIKSFSIYYDVSIKKPFTELPTGNSIKIFSLENSAITEECVGDIVWDEEDVEKYIQDELKDEFKKGERISEFSHEEPEIFAYKKDEAVTLKIESNILQIKAKDKKRDEFIHKNYSIETIMKIMNMKSKYHFLNTIKIKDYNLEEVTDIVNINLPYQLITTLDVKNQLSLSVDHDLKNSEYKLDKNMVNDLMQECNIEGIACYFNNNELFSIIPGKFSMNVEKYSDRCTLNLIVIKKNSEETKFQLLKQIFLKCIDKTNSFEYCDLIRILSKISNCKDYVEKFSELELNKAQGYIEKIDTFFKLNEAFLKMKEWEIFSKSYAETLLEELCSKVKKTEFSSQIILGNRLNEIIGLSERDFLLKISKNLIKDEGEVVTFEILEEVGYKTNKILDVVNIFEDYCKKIIEGEFIVSNSKLGNLCSRFGKSLLGLNKLVGIKKPREDFAELDFNTDEFIKIMTSFREDFSKIMKYKTYALEQCKVFEEFKERYTEIKDIIVIEKEALKNPKNINKVYIKQKLKKSEYKEAICDLYIRLQYELNKLYDVNNKTVHDLLSNDNIYQYLQKEEVDEMNILRKCRNNFQHPKERGKILYSEETIMKWCDIVEKLGGKE